MNKVLFVIGLIVTLVIISILANVLLQPHQTSPQPLNSGQSWTLYTKLVSPSQIDLVFGGNWTILGQEGILNQTPNESSLIPGGAAKSIITETFTSNNKPIGDTLLVQIFIYPSPSYSNEFFNNVVNNTGFVPGKLNNANYVLVNSSPDSFYAIDGNYSITFSYTNNVNNTHLSLNQAKQLLAYQLSDINIT